MALDVGSGATPKLTGKRKAAALLIALGPERAAPILKSMTEDDIEVLSAEIVRMQRIATEVRDNILQETYEEAMTRQYITEGGTDFARDLLARTLGTQKAQEMMTRTSGGQSRYFDFVRTVEPSQVVTFLEGEHPQTIALVMAHIPTELAGRILSSLEDDMQSDVASRIAMMGRTAPEVIKEVEAVLKRKMASVATQGFRAAGGVDYLVKVLGGVDRSTERSIMETMEQSDPELAAEIRQRSFTFEDFGTLEDRAIQRVLRDINQKDLAMALRGGSEDVKDKVLKGMSKRAAQMLRDDISVLGPVRLRLVEEAQQKIINTIRTLQEAEEIVISRGGDDDVLV